MYILKFYIAKLSYKKRKNRQQLSKETTEKASRDKRPPDLYHEENG